MNHTILGESGLSVSPIAFGTWQLSPRFWGELSKDEAVAAMRFAFDQGINFIDTADAYGDDYGESVVGEAIRELPRDELVVVTKVFNHFNLDGSRYPDLSPDHLVERCEASLRRLGIERIDLYPAPQTALAHPQGLRTHSSPGHGIQMLRMYHYTPAIRSVATRSPSVSLDPCRVAQAIARATRRLQPLPRPRHERLRS